MISDKTILIAHRGESFEAPENTLASVNLAWEKNIGAVEIDIRLTNDNKIVAIHDTNTARVGDKNLIIRKSYYSEISNINIFNSCSANSGGLKIPLLHDIIETIPIGKLLFVDIKCGDEIVSHLLELINFNKNKLSAIKLISLNTNVLSLIKKKMPEIDCYKIYKRKWYMFNLNAEKLIGDCKRYKFDGVDVLYGRFINKEFITAIKNAGLKIYTWTVNDPKIASQLISSGIDGITTDRANWIKNKLE